jgi:hypothetical protein
MPAPEGPTVWDSILVFGTMAVIAIAILVTVLWRW